MKKGFWNTFFVTIIFWHERRLQESILITDVFLQTFGLLLKQNEKNSQFCFKPHIKTVMKTEWKEFNFQLESQEKMLCAPDIIKYGHVQSEF